MRKIFQVFIFIITTVISAEFILEVVNSYFPTILYDSADGVDCSKLTCFSERYVGNIGWDNTKYDLDKGGIRNISAKYDEVCGASFGGSFVFSNDVESDLSFSSKLSEFLGCQVDNYGVGGYNFAQALKKYEQYNPHVRLLVLNLNRAELLSSLSGSSYSLSGGKVVNPRPYYYKEGDGFKMMELTEQKSENYIKTHLSKDYYLGWNPPKFPLILSLMGHNSDGYKRIWSWKDIFFLDITIFEELFEFLITKEITKIEGPSLILLNIYPQYINEENILKLENYISRLDTPDNICVSLPGRDLLKAINEGIEVKGKSQHFNSKGEEIIALNLFKSINICGGLK